MKFMNKFLIKEIEYNKKKPINILINVIEI